VIVARVGETNSRSVRTRESVLAGKARTVASSASAPSDGSPDAVDELDALDVQVARARRSPARRTLELDLDARCVTERDAIGERIGEQAAAVAGRAQATSRSRAITVRSVSRRLPRSAAWRRRAAGEAASSTPFVTPSSGRRERASNAFVGGAGHARVSRSTGRASDR